MEMTVIPDLQKIVSIPHFNGLLNGFTNRCILVLYNHISCPVKELPFLNGCILVDNTLPFPNYHMRM